MADAPALRGSPAGLLHPHGLAPRTTLLGGAVPAGLRPAVEHDGAMDPADLVLLAPDAAEQQSAEWWREAMVPVRAAAPGALVYLIAGPTARRRFLRDLRGAGWRDSGAWLHLPDIPRSAMLVPATAPGAAYAVAALPTRRRFERNLVRGALALPGAQRLLPSLAGAAGFALVREGAAPPLAWLTGLEPAPAAGGVALLPGWRAGNGRVTFIGLDGAGAAAWVGKAALDGPALAALDAEAARLGEMGATAAAAGAAVPAMLERGGAAEGMRARCRFQTAVPGASYAALLARGDAAPDGVVRRVGAWLAGWHRATLRRSESAALLARELLEPLETVAAEVEHPAFVAGVRARAAAAPPGLAVAAHGDLTMTNLLDAGDWLGVVDWEVARMEGLPLGDLAYAAVDAVLAAGAPDRVAAWEACFGPGGAMGGQLGRIIGETAAMLQLDPPAVRLCLDACWIAHAANERARSAAGAARPFLAVLRRHAAAADA